jgi:hypothetical protein
MTRSLRNFYFRVPNFGVEGAVPQRRPEWVDRNWRIVPPASPPWSPPPSPPEDGTDPFGDPPDVQPPLQPRSDDVPHRAGSDLIDWLFNTYRSHRERSAKQFPWPEADGRAPDLFPDSRPWQVTESPPWVLQPLPFHADQAETLLRMRPEDLQSPTRREASKERGVQPPIFFPFD